MGRPGAIINISGTSPVDDPEYRYKMPTVFGKVEGRGNGIKTAIPNVSDVARSLHRDPGEVNKFFGCELGAQTTFNVETDRAIVNGKHEDAILQTLIHKYIENFVLCPNCGLPETEYKIKLECIYHKCAACGNTDMVDMTHKLCTYILAQNKKDKKAKAEAKKKADKDKKKDKKDKKKDKEDGDGSDEDKKKEKKDIKKKDKKEKDGKKEKKDKKKDKKLKASGDSLGKMKDLDIDSDEPIESVDDANAMALAVEGTKKFLAENTDASAAAIAEKVMNEQMASGLKSQDKIHIYIQAVFTTDFIKNKEVEKFSEIITKITQGKTVMERNLISACEALCVDKPKSFAVMIKQLFDEDALEEDTILEWAGEGRTEYTLESVDEDRRAALRGEAEPVVVWLQEEDSSDEDSD